MSYRKKLHQDEPKASPSARKAVGHYYYFDSFHDDEQTMYEEA
jgi:hypothetical protein